MTNLTLSELPVDGREVERGRPPVEGLPILGLVYEGLPQTTGGPDRKHQDPPSWTYGVDNFALQQEIAIRRPETLRKRLVRTWHP